MLCFCDKLCCQISYAWYVPLPTTTTLTSVSCEKDYCCCHYGIWTDCKLVKACNSRHTPDASLKAALPHLQPLYGPAWQHQVPVCLLPPESWLQHTPSPRPQSHWAAQRLAQLESLHTQQQLRFPLLHASTGFGLQQWRQLEHALTGGQQLAQQLAHMHIQRTQARAVIARCCSYKFYRSKRKRELLFICPVQTTSSTHI